MRFQADMKQIGNAAVFEEQDYYALYRPAIARAALASGDYDQLQDSILAAIELRKNTTYKGFEVEGVYAQKGYGPIIYLLAAQYAQRHGGLMPTRVRQYINPKSSNIWKNFYDGKGSNLVKVVDTAMDHHDEPWLNIKILPKKRINLSQARRRHQQVIGHDPHDERRTLVWEAAETVLRSAISPGA